MTDCMFQALSYSSGESNAEEVGQARPHLLTSSKSVPVARRAFSLLPNATAARGLAGLSSAVYLLRLTIKLSSTWGRQASPALLVTSFPACRGNCRMQPNTGRGCYMQGQGSRM